MNQQMAIAIHLKQAPISQLIAAHKHGVLRLSERVRELESRGFQINRRWAEFNNRYGNTSRYVVYSMPSNNKNDKLFKALFGKKECK